MDAGKVAANIFDPAGLFHSKGDDKKSDDTPPPSQQVSNAAAAGPGCEEFRGCPEGSWGHKHHHHHHHHCEEMRGGEMDGGWQGPQMYLEMGIAV